MVAVVTADAGEAALEVAALEELVNDLGDDRAQETVTRLVLRGIGFDKFVKMAVGALPEGRLSRIAGAIGLHESTGQPKEEVCHLTAQVQKA